MQKLLRWFDNNIISIISGILLVFIPLYPKLPLFDALPGYIVRIRLEDFFVSFSIFIWLIWILRGKIQIKSPLSKPILAYLIVGILSMISAVFITQTVYLDKLQVPKMILHFLRRVEYFSLFFIFYSSIRSVKQIKIYLTVLVLTILAVAIYGFGQKYFYWPAFSTMNREFSKGWMLYLTKHARVLSTFGGHYDLAAYIMMALIVLWSLFFGIKKLVWKILIFLVIAAAFWTLILTASRTSFLAYIGGVSVMFFFWIYRFGIGKTFLRWLTVIMLSIIVMLSFGDLSERFTKLLKIDDRISGLKFLLLSPIGTPPGEKAVFLENNPEMALSQITSSSDQPPTPKRPSDVYQDIPLMIPSATDSSKLVEKTRTYSKTAFMYDLSTAIRFDALWPMAIAGLKRNPVLGSGYATLNKTQPNQFTEAESTDNDYLRSLGETGILGFITFFGILIFIMYYLWRNIPLIKDPLIFSMVSGLAGLIFGLLVNAVYIDVFESSKVAFSFWAIVGLVMGTTEVIRKDTKAPVGPTVIPGFKEFRHKAADKLKKFFTGDLFYLLIILVLAFALRLYKINSPLADWHSWRQADTSAVTRNYVKHGINLLYPTYDDISNVASGKDNPKGLRLVEFPLYNLASVITDKIVVGYNIDISGRLTSIFASLGSIVFLFMIVKKYLGRKEGVVAAIFYAILPYNIFYNRVILPEPFLVFLSLGMIYFWDKLIEVSVKKDRGTSTTISFIQYFILGAAFAALALLVKPTAGFLFLPMAYLWFKNKGIGIKSVISLAIYFGIVFVPLLLWRQWISQFPEGVPAYTWLLNGDNIRFKGAFFYWLFADRLVRLILGYWGITLLVIGVIARVKKEGWFFYIWGLSMLLYLTVVATGNVRHDYYQIIIIPIIVIFMTKGFFLMLDLAKNYTSKYLTLLFLIVIILLTEMFGWYHIRDYFNINHPEIVEAGRTVERITKDKALVIAPYNGDTAFLYQTNRSGWPIIEDSIDKMISMGADYYVSVNFDDLTKKMISDATNPDGDKRKYKLIQLTGSYVIIQLVPDNKLPR